MGERDQPQKCHRLTVASLAHGDSIATPVPTGPSGGAALRLRRGADAQCHSRSGRRTRGRRGWGSYTPPCPHSYRKGVKESAWELLSKQQEIASVGEAVERREPCSTVGGNGNWHNCRGKQYESSSKETKNRAAIYSENLALGVYLKTQKQERRSVHVPHVDQNSVCRALLLSLQPRHGSNLSVHPIEEWVKMVLYALRKWNNAAQP